jgi:hypothetical protein
LIQKFIARQLARPSGLFRYSITWRWLTRFMFTQFKVEEQFDKMARLIAEEAARDESTG